MSSLSNPKPKDEILDRLEALMARVQQLRGAVTDCDPSGGRAEVLMQLDQVTSAHVEVKQALRDVDRAIADVLPNWMWEWP